MRRLMGEELSGDDWGENNKGEEVEEVVEEVYGEEAVEISTSGVMVTCCCC